MPIPFLFALLLFSKSNDSVGKKDHGRIPGSVFVPVSLSSSFVFPFQREPQPEAAVSFRTVVTFVTWLISRNQPCHKRDHSSKRDRSLRLRFSLFPLCFNKSIRQRTSVVIITSFGVLSHYLYPHLGPTTIAYLLYDDVLTYCYVCINVNMHVCTILHECVCT